MWNDCACFQQTSTDEFYDTSQQENGNILEISMFIFLLEGIAEDCQHTR